MTNLQKILILIVLIVNFYLLLIIFRYWKADIYYSLSKTESQNKSLINKALQISPNEPLYISEEALINSNIDTAKKALDIAPFNQNVRKVLISNLFKNSTKEPDNLKLAEAVIKDGIDISPNDPRLYYQLGIVQIRIGNVENGVNSLIKSISLKPNYKEARFALGAIYIDTKEFDKAKIELEYILKFIDPNDDLTKKYLEESNQPQK